MSVSHPEAEGLLCGAHSWHDGPLLQQGQYLEAGKADENSLTIDW